MTEIKNNSLRVCCGGRPSVYVSEHDDRPLFTALCPTCSRRLNSRDWTDLVYKWNCTEEGRGNVALPSKEAVMDQRIAELEEANSNLLHQCRAKDDTIAMLEHAIKGMKSEETKWKDEYECLLNAINLIVERENRRNGD